MGKSQNLKGFFRFFIFLIYNIKYYKICGLGRTQPKRLEMHWVAAGPLRKLGRDRPKNI